MWVTGFLRRVAFLPASHDGRRACPALPRAGSPRAHLPATRRAEVKAYPSTPRATNHSAPGPPTIQDSVRPRAGASASPSPSPPYISPHRPPHEPTQTEPKRSSSPSTTKSRSASSPPAIAGVWSRYALPRAPLRASTNSLPVCISKFSGLGILLRGHG
jgi:hypothetical protein